MNHLNLSQRLRALIDKLKPMTPGQRIAYIWTYYKIQIFLLIICIIFLVSTVNTLSNASKEPLVSGVLANIELNSEGWDYIKDNFFAYLDGDEATQAVKVSVTDFSDIYSNFLMFDSSYSSVMNTVSMVSSGMLDYLLMSEDALSFFMTQDVFLDLREFFTADELEALGDKVIYLELVDDDGTTVSRTPVAINISNIPFVQNCLDPVEDCYFSLSATSEQLKNCRIFWDYLLAWEATGE